MTHNVLYLNICDFCKVRVRNWSFLCDCLLRCVRLRIDPHVSFTIVYAARNAQMSSIINQNWFLDSFFVTIAHINVIQGEAYDTIPVLTRLLHLVSSILFYASVFCLRIHESSFVAQFTMNLICGSQKIVSCYPSVMIMLTLVMLILE